MSKNADSFALHDVSMNLADKYLKNEIGVPLGWLDRMVLGIPSKRTYVQAAEENPPSGQREILLFRVYESSRD